MSARIVALLGFAALVSRAPCPVFAQQRATLDVQLRESQTRLETIRRERSAVEEELERLRTQVHSLSDELSNLDRQKQSTTRIVNELDRQINGLTQQIDHITVDLLLAQDALLEKKAVAERRIVDIYKRGALYATEVMLRAESFGDLLSRYKYLYLVSRQDRLLANDMYKLRDRVARERRLLVQARQQLETRRSERAQELSRFARLERERQSNLREMRRSEREAQRRLGELERDERTLNDRIEGLERARREAEARGGAAAPASISSADLGGLDWPVDGRVIYEFGASVGPNNTRIPWHGIGIAAPAGTPVHAVSAGTVSLAGPLGTYLVSVLLDHGGGYYTFYAYLKDASVSLGQRVLKGQVLGHVGGEATRQGAHLHFEIRGQGGIALDPLNWLKKKRR
jgi:septal ring factor EnvC (AmiA/AmiB activator)